MTKPRQHGFQRNHWVHLPGRHGWQPTNRTIRCHPFTVTAAATRTYRESGGSRATQTSTVALDGRTGTAIMPRPELTGEVFFVLCLCVSVCVFVCLFIYLFIMLNVNKHTF